MFGGRKNTKVKHESKGRQSEFDFLKRMRGKAEEEALMQEEKNILVKEQNEQAQPHVRGMVRSTIGKIIKERGQKQPFQKLDNKFKPEKKGRFTKRKTDEPVKYGGANDEKDTRESELDFLKRVRGTAEEKALEQEERAILQKEAQIQDYPQLKKSVFKSLKGTIDQRGQRKPWQKLYEGIEPEPREAFKRREVLAPIAYDAPDKKENDAIKAEMNAIKNKVNEEKLNDIANAVKAIEKSTGERVTQEQLKKIAKEVEQNYKNVNKELDIYLKEFKEPKETTKRRINVMKGHSKGEGYLMAGAFAGPSGIKNRFDVNKMTDDEFEAYNIMMSKAPKGKNAYGYPDTDVGIGAGMNKKLINRPVDTVMIDKMKKQALKEIRPLVKGVANYKSRGEDYLAELDPATLKSNLPYNTVEQEIDRQKAYKKAIKMTRKRLL